MISTNIWVFDHLFWFLQRGLLHLSCASMCMLGLVAGTPGLFSRHLALILSSTRDLSYFGPVCWLGWSGSYSWFGWWLVSLPSHVSFCWVGSICEVWSLKTGVPLVQFVSIQTGWHIWLVLFLCLMVIGCVSSFKPHPYKPLKESPFHVFRTHIYLTEIKIWSPG